MQFNRIAKAVRNPAGTLTPAKQTLLANAVLEACDKLDGVADGIISRPAACNFDPAARRCAAPEKPMRAMPACRTRRSPPSGPSARRSPPLTASGDSVQGAFSDDFVSSFATRNPEFDPSTLDPNLWRASLSLIGSMYQAFNPVLGALKAHGAKMIMLNGTTDTSVSPRDTARYYDQVVGKMGQAETDQFLELFLAAGVGHCFGSVGPDQVDLLKVLSTWVENGTPPSRQGLLLTKMDANQKVAMARPKCKRPAYPRYKGAGDVNDAASFTCSTE